MTPDQFNTLHHDLVAIGSILQALVGIGCLRLFFGVWK